MELLIGDLPIRNGDFDGILIQIYGVFNGAFSDFFG
jgi:hypothetical protein